MLSFQFLHKGASMFISLSSIHIVICYRIIIANYNYYNGLPGFSFIHVTVSVASHRNGKAKYIVIQLFLKKKNIDENLLKIDSLKMRNQKDSFLIKSFLLEKKNPFLLNNC